MKRLVVGCPGAEDRFSKQWKWIAERRRLENSGLGVAIQVFDALDAESEEVAYEGIAIESRRIELHVVVREDDRHIGLVLHRRLSVIPPEVSKREFGKNPSGILSVLEHATGIEEYEASHGLAEDPLEEIRQEFGLHVIEAELIGFVKESPPLGRVIARTLRSFGRS